MKKDYIVIVSGLPRSGTSLMMQMLEAGGLQALTDGARPADADNPRGYCEFEAVKRTRQDPAWLDQAGGKCVKMVSMLLYDLPPGKEYRIIFMRRAMDEVLASQAAMLRNRGESRELDDGEMRLHYEVHLGKLEQWLKTRKNMKVLHCDYSSLIQDPARQALAVRDFLAMDLDLQKMASAVDPALYRQRQAG